MIATVVSTVPYAIAVREQVYEADDTLGLTPAVSDVVLADWLPSSGQYIIVAIVPP